MGHSNSERRSGITRDRSPVRESRTPGSVRGAASNRRPYRDRSARNDRETLPFWVSTLARCRSMLVEGNRRDVMNDIGTVQGTLTVETAAGQVMGRRLSRR